MQLSCLYPKVIYNKYTQSVEAVSCRTCSVCRQSYINDWSLRLQVEMRNHRFCRFVTLTYNDLSLKKLHWTQFYNRTILQFYGIYEYDETYRFFRALRCSRYVKAYDGWFPYAPISDAQRYIKRLRMSILRDSRFSEQTPLVRYYAVRDYGTTSFRPHWHVLLFYDNETLDDCADEIFSSSWSTYLKYLPVSRRKAVSKGFVRVELPRSSRSLATYVTAYINCLASVPEELRFSYFSPKAVFSKKPPIGFERITKEQIRKIYDGALTKFSFVKPSSNELVNVPLWRTLETWLFEKCFGFGRLLHLHRVALYAVSSKFACYEEYQSFILSKWQAILTCSMSDYDFYAYRFIVQDKYPSYCSQEFVKHMRKLRITNTLKQIWLCSERTLRFVSMLDVTLDAHVVQVEKYWSKKNYENLYNQLSKEEQFASSSVNLPLNYFPYVIDPAFRENKRKLSPAALDSYKAQFNCDMNEDLSQTSFYQSVKLRYDLVEHDRKSRRLKSDFLSRHPQYKVLHSYSI